MLASRRERLEAVAHAQLAASQPALSFFTPEQAAEIEAAAARIFPTDDTPGAREAGVVYFIDRGLTSWARAQQPLFREGLTQLSRDVAARFPGRVRFATLAPAEQDDVLRAMEQSDFFGALRFATLAGVFSLPQYGGNRDFVGWKLIGQDTVLDFRPPFGWYDDPAHRRALFGGDA